MNEITHDDDAHDDILALGACALADAVRRGELTARRIAEVYLDRIARLDPNFDAFLEVDSARVRERADAVDHRRANGEALGLLAGVPIAVKDNIHVRDHRTTCGSRMLEHYRPVFDATVVAKLHAADAVVIGKTNLDEFGMGSSTENSAFGPTKNPWDTSRTPGGSSGGSASAVAARLAPVALGSDTGGSIRQPAAFTSTTGMKPTYGRVSRYGVAAYGSSLDQIGPITRDAADAARVLDVIAGHDANDGTTIDDQSFATDIDGPVRRDGRPLRIGVPRESMDDAVDADVRTVVTAAIETFRADGADVVDVDLPHMRHAIPVYYLVATSEASSNLARYDGTTYGYRTADARDIGDMFLDTRGEAFGDEVTRRIMLGTFALSAGYTDAYYKRAMRVRTLIKRDFDQAFEGTGAVDVLVGPTSPFPPFRLGEKVDDPIAMYLADVFTVPVNLAGVPAISVPGGFVERDGSRLPVGLQIIAPAREDVRLLGVAAQFQRLTSHHRESPST